jgi:hypothetical protein
MVVPKDVDRYQEDARQVGGGQDTVGFGAERDFEIN